MTAGCSGAASSQNSVEVEQLPTLARLDVPPTYTLQGAERVAVDFLESWRIGDFETMYNLTSFASQEAMPFETFSALYTDAHEEMTLLNLSFTANTLIREQPEVALFDYNVLFETNVIGQFEDNNRTLRLVVDERADDWRVAWTPADIFAEMETGARLRLERVIPSRANIYDRNGQVLADQNGRMVTVQVIKRDIPDFTTCLNTLAATTGDDVLTIRTVLDEAGADWLTDVGTILPQTYLEMQQRLEIDCDAHFDDRPVRRYVVGPATAHIVGNVGFPDEADLPEIEAAGFDADTILGKSGIEATWDETLRGKPGGRLSIISPAGERLRVITETRSQPAESVWLTIDSELQQFTYNTIARTYANAAESWAPGSDGAAAVVIEIATGKILAMVSYPTFDPNLFTPFPPLPEEQAFAAIQQVQEDPRRPQLNRATLGGYPLGSVMKTVSTLAVTDSGVYDLDTTYNCAGVWNRDIPRFDWRPGGHGVLTLSQAIIQSCNSYFYEVGYQLDQVDPFILPEMARNVGLGTLTGLRDLPENPGNIPDPDWVAENVGLNWTFSDSVNTAVGQGYVEVTPLQVARLFAAYGNGGTLMRPQLVEQVGIIGEAPSYIAEPEVDHNIGVRRSIIELLQTSLCEVTTNPQGTATHIFRGSELQTIGVCGKTGTAQAPGAGTAPHAWFAAYAPRENPEIAIAVLVENSGDGSAVAAPITRAVLEFYFFGDE